MNLAGLSVLIGVGAVVAAAWKAGPLGVLAAVAVVGAVAWIWYRS
jgi:hypothetical protein